MRQEIQDAPALLNVLLHGRLEGVDHICTHTTINFNVPQHAGSYNSNNKNDLSASSRYHCTLLRTKLGTLLDVLLDVLLEELLDVLLDVLLDELLSILHIMLGMSQSNSKIVGFRQVQNQRTTICYMVGRKGGVYHEAQLWTAGPRAKQVYTNKVGATTKIQIRLHLYEMQLAMYTQSLWARDYLEKCTRKQV